MFGGIKLVLPNGRMYAKGTKLKVTDLSKLKNVPYGLNKNMLKYSNKVVTVQSCKIDPDFFQPRLRISIEEDRGAWIWALPMFDCSVGRSFVKLEELSNGKI